MGYKIIIINILKKLMKRWISLENQNLEKELKGILEMKTSITEVKDSVDEFNSKLDTAVGRIVNWLIGQLENI